MNRADLKFKFVNPSTGLFKDQLFNEIEAVDQREQVEDLADNSLFFDDDAEKYIRQGSATGTDAYSASVNSPTAIHTSQNLIVVSFSNASTGAVTLNVDAAGAKKVYITPTTQAGAGDIVQNAAYMLRYHNVLDSGAGGWLMISGGTGGGGAGVSDGSKTGVMVSGSGTIWLPTDYVNNTVVTTGSTITLPINSKYEAFFTGLTTFATPKTLVRTGETRALRWTFMWEVTDVAATLDFGSDTRAPSTTTAGLFSGGVFTPGDVGAYKVVATRRYDNVWWLDFRGVYSVGDAPPTPADLWILSTGYWNDSEYWDDGSYWKD